ncbi:hypothetical protein DRP53_00960 [candidate division WOR-3 bacterium]|uniref:GGDEF domain-containing protein n=1 Tax=candidate division WOR-3 bacterium TaxID=2052148 RepID=A0A660SL86_UNCW3|nr:MAG: hypothetical protein DRP53_00960 [candidate division WOR-3 bacterium]
MVPILAILTFVFFILWIVALTSKGRLKGRVSEKESLLEGEIRRLSTEIKNLTARIKWLNLTYQQLLSSVIHLSSMLSLDEIKEAVIRIVINAVDCHEAVLFLADENEEYLRPIAATGIPREELTRLSLRFGEGRVGLVAQRRLTLTDKEFSFYLPREGHGYRPQICSPIIFQTRLLGVIAVGGLNRASEDQKQILNFIAAATGMALNNAMSFQRLQYSASIDKLTQLYHIQFFRDRLNEAIRGAKANGRPVSVCLTDLDKFKTFNDTFGHPMGDRLLYRIARIYTEMFPDLIIARYGGDEFIILAEGKDRNEMYQIAENLRKRIEKEGYSAGKGERITLSAGVAAYPDDATSGEELIKMADQALYLAKKQGRNRVVLYTPS